MWDSMEMSGQDTDHAKVLKKRRGRPKKVVTLPKERRTTFVPVLPHPEGIPLKLKFII
jgi:AT hook motif.